MPGAHPALRIVAGAQLAGAPSLLDEESTRHQTVFGALDPRPTELLAG